MTEGDRRARQCPLIVAHELGDRFVRPTREGEWNVVGVFYLKDGLIEEWSDYIVT